MRHFPPLIGPIDVQFSHRSSYYLEQLLMRRVWGLLDSCTQFKTFLNIQFLEEDSTEGRSSSRPESGLPNLEWDPLSPWKEQEKSHCHLRPQWFRLAASVDAGPKPGVAEAKLTSLLRERGGSGASSCKSLTVRTVSPLKGWPSVLYSQTNNTTSSPETKRGHGGTHLLNLFMI